MYALCDVVGRCLRDPKSAITLIVAFQSHFTTILQYTVYYYVLSLFVFRLRLFTHLTHLTHSLTHSQSINQSITHSLTPFYLCHSPKLSSLSRRRGAHQDNESVRECGAVLRAARCRGEYHSITHSLTHSLTT